MSLRPCLFLILFAVAFHQCSAMIIDNAKFTVTEDDRFTILWSFEFGAGGQLNFSVKMDDTPSLHQQNTSLQLLWCAEPAINVLRKAHFADVCASTTFDYVGCEWQTQLGQGYPGNNTSFNWRAPNRGWYRLLQLNCQQTKYSGAVSLVAVNPGGEYLSLADVPFKSLSLASSVMWAVLSVAWCANWVRYWPWNIKLQRVLTLFPLVKGVKAVVLTMYWKEASRSGYFPSSFDWPMVFANTAVQLTMLGCVFLIASGWMITRGLSVPASARASGRCFCRSPSLKSSIRGIKASRCLR